MGKDNTYTEESIKGTQEFISENDMRAKCVTLAA